MAEPQEWRRCYLPPAALQGERSYATAVGFGLFYFFSSELYEMLYGLLLLLSCLKA